MLYIYVIYVYILDISKTWLHCKVFKPLTSNHLLRCNDV